MKKIILYLGTLFFAICTVSCSDDDKGCDVTIDTSVKSVVKTNTDTKVFAHFMLWYNMPEGDNGRDWGQHWKKGLSPVFENGEWKNLYTRYNPLTGPYNSDDEMILEYQLLLMKYAGIDGVIADWYGVSDRGSNEDKTKALEALAVMCEEVGLELAVCYEDRFKDGTENAMIESVKSDMNYLQGNFFVKNYYSKINGKPLLLVFGPMKLASLARVWNQCFADVPSALAFYPLEEHGGDLLANGVAVSVYNWSNNSVLDASRDQVYLSQFKTSASTPNRIRVAMPGFFDVYRGAAYPTGSMRKTEHQGGAFFKQQLNLAKQYKTPLLQICTWNDYGEGTIVEPTVPNAEQNSNNPYIYLEQLQEFTGVDESYKDVLPQIKRYYDIRKANSGNADVTARLQFVFLCFRSLQPDVAVEKMNQIVR